MLSAMNRATLNAKRSHISEREARRPSRSFLQAKQATRHENVRAKRADFLYCVGAVHAVSTGETAYH